MPAKSAVLVPLYIYPVTPNTWEPLYKAVQNHPNLTFLVIVNPNSGPGTHPQPSPDANYAREVPRLNSYANVITVGYVRIDYCRKLLYEVFAEIDLYASWASKNPNPTETNKALVGHGEQAKDPPTASGGGLGLSGILVDETPNHYSDVRKAYLDELHAKIKNTSGILGERLVIHNPGTPPDAGLAVADPRGADIMIVCEEPYPRYRSDEVQDRLEELHYDRERVGYMINEVPTGGGCGEEGDGKGEDELRPLVEELRHRGKYLFVTEVVGDFYERFGPTSWKSFVEAMDAEAGDVHGENGEEEPHLQE